MKKHIHLLLAVFGLTIILISSCKKDSTNTNDPCTNVTCFNGGTCVNGSCNCPPGYSGVNCETHDPCYGITCLNGGTCANGICNCPPGYTGSDCGTAMTPVSVTVSKIVLSNYPMTTTTGGGWDVSNGPDIFLSINQGTTANDVQFSGISNNATGTSITYTTNFPTNLMNPSGNYTIGLWDYDSPDPDDFMGGIYFIPNDYDSGFPSTITLSTASISMTLYVTWNF